MRVQPTAYPISSLALVKEFIWSKESEGKSAKTIQWYECELRLCLDWCAREDIELAQATQHELRRYFRELAGHRKIISVGTSFRAIRAWFNWLVSEEVIETNPCIRIELPRETLVKQPYSPEEIAALFRATEQSEMPFRNAMILTMLLDTGMRASELVRLDITDCDFNTGAIVVYGKGRKQRTLPMSVEVAKSLRKYLSRERPRLLEEGDITGHLLIGRGGILISYWGLKEIMRRLGRCAGLPNVHCHRFRHTWMTEMAKAGVSAPILQSLAGHTNIQTSVRYINQAAVASSAGHLSVTKMMQKK